MSRRAKIVATLGSASSSPERLTERVAAGIGVARVNMSHGTARHTDAMVGQVEEVLPGIGRCDKGDMVVIVAGSPPGTPGRTNALRVHRIGDAAALGAGLG